MAKPTAVQLEKINKFAKEPLTKDNCYVHGFRLIGTKLITDRYLKIDESLLEVYLQDIKNGDVVQIADHSMGGIKSWFGITLPFGRFFDGKLTVEGEETHLDGWMYMKSGQKTYVQPFTTDDISEQLDAGTLDDSSVGIAWDRSECSICGNDIRSSDCPHWPGRTYKIHEKDELCYVIAKPASVNTRAYMAENSLVGVGAYSDAGHLAKEAQAPEKPKYRKVNNMMELKLIPKEEPVFCLFSADRADILTRTDFEPDAAKLHDLCHKSYHLMKEQGNTVGQAMRELTQKHTEAVEKLITQQEHYLEDALDGNLPGHLKRKSIRREENTMDALIAEIFKTANIDPSQIEKANEQGFLMKDGEQIYLSKDVIKIKDTELADKLQKAETKVKELEPLAKDGEAFRKEVIEAALAAGVRAQGNEFPADTWKETFKTMSIQAIRDIAGTFQSQAETQIPAGRKTNPSSAELNNTVSLPDEACRI